MKGQPEVEGLSSGDTSSRLSTFGKTIPTTGHFANISLLIAVVVVLFWRVFLLGETLIDLNTLNNQLPWGYSAGQSEYPYNRRDLTDTYVTREYFVVQAYRDAEFPFWNPYTMAGHPIYADGVTRTLSPSLLLYTIFDVPLGYSLARLIELMFAAIAMYIFLNAIGVSSTGALFGSLIFELSAHSMLHLTGLGWWGGLMWLPLILLFVDRAIQKQSYANATLAGVCLAAQFFFGYLPNQIYYVGAVFLYYAFFAFAMRRRRHREMSRTIGMMFLTLIVGLTLSSTQWVPSLELLSYSNRKIVGAELGYVYLPPWYAGTLIFPNLFGAAYDTKALTLFTALGVSHDHILYFGIAALLPLGYCVYRFVKTRRKPGESSQESGVDQILRNRIALFVLLGVCSLIVMMTAPAYVHLTRFIPILQVIRVAVRAGVLFLFASVTLAAFGLDALLTAESDQLKRFVRGIKRSAVAVTAMVFAAAVGSYFISRSVTVDPGARGRVAFVQKTALLLASQFTPPNLSIVIPLLFIVAAVALLWGFAGDNLRPTVFAAGMIGLLILDLSWNSGQFDHAFDRSRIYPKTEITDLLKSLPSGRVLITPSGLETNRSISAGMSDEKIIAPPNTLLPYQILTVSGKNQQFPKWYREYASLVEPQPNLSHVVFDQNRSPFFDALNVRYVLTHDSAPLKDYELIKSAEGVSVYENKAAMPRVFFAGDVIEVAGPAESLARMRSPDFDPHKMTVVENSKSRSYEDGIIRDTFGAGTPTRAIANIKVDARNSVVVETEDEAGGLLVLSDNYYPGWTATIDGQPTKIFRANHTMRAVHVPAGQHLVSFRFAPPLFFASLYVSGVAGVMTLAFLALSFVFSRRGTGHDLRKDKEDS